MLWLVAAAWALALAGVLVVRSRQPTPVLSAAQAASVANDSVHLAGAGTGAAARVATLRAIEPGGGQGTVRIGSGGVKVLDFFATWCHACNLDMAAMKRYATVARHRALPALVAVDLRVAEPSTAYVRRFVSAAALAFPVGLDSTGKVSDAYDVTELPTVILVAPGGRVLWRHIGTISAAGLVAAVEAHDGHR